MNADKGTDQKQGLFVFGSALSRNHNSFDGQDVIHRAGAVALGVEGDVGEAERAQRGGDLVKGFDGQGMGEIGAGDLDAGEVAMMADADLKEAEGVQGVFGAFNLAEVFRRYSSAVFDAG